MCIPGTSALSRTETRGLPGLAGCWLRFFQLMMAVSIPLLLAPSSTFKARKMASSNHFASLILSPSLTSFPPISLPQLLEIKPTYIYIIHYRYIYNTCRLYRHFHWATFPALSVKTKVHAK